MSLVGDLGSFAATAVRLGRGIRPTVTSADRPEPAQLLELYDFEACPYCRKVREVLCELDLDHITYPVAAGSPRRAELVRRGGRLQVPFLVDRNTATQLYESEDIIAYLNATYGAGRRAGWPVLVPRLVDDVDSMLATAMRLGHGARCRHEQHRQGIRLLTLYNREGSPFCRKVREALSELDLEYVARNLPTGSPKCEELVRRGGKMQIPYLIDPNTGTELYESEDIVAYLERQYA